MPTNAELRSLPSVDRLLEDPRLRVLADDYSHAVVADLVRRELEEARNAVRRGTSAPACDSLIAAVLRRARQTWAPWPAHVINATGVILHTNMGRAPMSEAAARASDEAARGYTNLEMDMETGKRGSRQAHISELLRQVTGAESGIAVNNNATAVLLGLSALASGGEVIVSRGEAVEIGGGFRIPDVLAQSGTTLVEVGTTNRTYIRDYEQAITPDTAALLKVHRSNFTLAGFTHDATLEELVALGRDRDLPVLHDLGSGCLLDTARYGMDHEPTVQESVSAGADVVFFSGDKLLGGPQAGIAVGRSEHIEPLARHPLARAVRMDKTTLAALSATLTAYVTEKAEEDIPIWRMISASSEALAARARRWQEALGAGELRESRSPVGGGSLPGQTIPTTVLTLSPSCGPDRFCHRLRQATTPVVARIERGDVLLDPRTVLPGEDETVIEALRAALAPKGP